MVMNATRMKVLWLCNCALSDLDSGASGTWLGAMARGLVDSDTIDLAIIAPGLVSQFTRADYHKVKQWLVPIRSPRRRDGLPPPALVQSIVASVDEFAPDLIHIWGTESFWGLLSSRGFLKYPTLLEMQGLVGRWAKAFCGDLTLREQLRCIGIRELLRCRTLQSGQRDFARWGVCEQEMIRSQRFVDIQSPWMAALVRDINPAAQLFAIDLALRQPFYDAGAWQLPCRPTLFCTAACSVPYKGLHVAIRALGLLIKRIPNVRLRIAGAHQRDWIRQDGYMRWINRLICQLGLTDAVEWLGPLSAEQIVVELQNAAATVIPTFIENCCTAMQEAMAVGTPVVVSYAGGIPSLAKDEDSCLFFPPGDEAMCAYQLERVLTDRELALRLSRESRQIAALRNDRQRLVDRQLEIYRNVTAANERTR